MIQLLHHHGHIVGVRRRRRGKRTGWLILSMRLHRLAGRREGCPGGSSPECKARHDAEHAALAARRNRG
jgi:hypothetical protein